ncbi:MAG: sulfite exporter TauE/SafE family protein, partial [Desulfococcus sp.]
MKFFKEWGRFMMMGARAHADWEIAVSNTIVKDRKRIMILGLLLVPIILGGIAFADQIGTVMPEVLGGKKAYSPAFFTT